MSMEHIFVDVETSGLNPNNGEIIEIAAVRTDSKGNILGSVWNRVKPEGPVDAEAAKVNGYSEQGWKDAVPYRTAINSLSVALVQDRPKYVVVAYNAPFDEGFLKHNCQKHSVDFPFGKRAWVDVYQLAWVLAYNSKIENRKLKTVAEYYGIDIQDHHTASGDVRILMEVYFRMMSRLSLASKVETFGKVVASDLFQKAIASIQR